MHGCGRPFDHPGSKLERRSGERLLQTRRLDRVAVTARNFGDERRARDDLHFYVMGASTRTGTTARHANFCLFLT